MGLFSGAILSMLQKTKSIGLKKKVLLLYGGVVVVPILIVGLVAENMILNSLRADYATSVSETALQLGKNVEFRKQSYELLAIRTATDGELIERLSKKYTDMITQWDTIHYLDKSFGLICNYLPGISSFRIYNINDSLVEDTHFLWKPDTNRKYAGINEKDWFDSLSSDPIAMKWTAIKDKYGRMDLILTRQITLSLGESIGIISFRINGSQVFGDLTSNAFMGVGRIYLINNDTVIASTPNEAVGKVVSQTELNNISFSDTPIEAVINQTKVMVVTEQVSPGWKVVCAVPMDKLEIQTRRTSLFLYLFIISLIILSGLLMVMVMNNLLKRIYQLGTHMKTIQQGHFDVSVNRENMDELGDLEEKFNNMAIKLDGLTEEIVVTRLHEREQSLVALQAQINPHFLYNTLSILRWRAIDFGDEISCKIVDAMTVFYRLALNSGKSVMKISDEISHVKAYLEIQQLRYNNCVEVIWNVDESLLHYYTLKLVLQPIVENCYMHGFIADKQDGRIEIVVFRTKDSICLQVEDNGQGMNLEDAEAIYYSVSKPNNGYGIGNIQERLRMYFGENAKIVIASARGKGTKVMLVIPVCSEPPTIKEGEQQ